MNTGIHIIVGDTDEVLAVVSQDPSMTPALQLYNQDMIGGPVTLTFGSDPAEGLEVVATVIDRLVLIRDALESRAALYRTRDLARPRLVHAAAGDPAGEGPDFPATDEP